MTPNGANLRALAEPGYTIWRAWRDGMLAQGREVAAERMAWETLPERDKALDAAIEREAVEAALTVEAIAAALRSTFPAPESFEAWQEMVDRTYETDAAALRAALLATPPEAK
jgi:hypothetical protein